MYGFGFSTTFHNSDSAVAPVNTIAPAITGTAQVGQTLTCSSGTWTGTAPITYAYQWKRNGSNIGGATNSTYTLVTADAGTTVSCTVTATNGAGSASANATGVSVTFETDAQAFITAASITDPTQQGAVNQLVIDLKAASIWSKGTIIKPLIGGSASAHLYDLKTATQVGSYAGGVTHNSNGVTYNGTTGYHSSGFFANVSNQYNRSFFQYIRNVTSNETTSWQGAFDGGDVFGYMASLRSTAGNIFTINQDGLNRLSPYQSVGLIPFGLVGVTVTASNSAKAYSNSSVKISTATPNATPNANVQLFSGALSSSGSPLFYGNHNIAFEWYGTGLTDTDVTNLYTAVQTFQTTLSRNV